MIRGLILAVVLCQVVAADDDVTLVRDGEPAALIVVGERPSIVARFAAEELRDYLAAMSGARLPIVARAEQGIAAIVIERRDMTGFPEADAYMVKREGRTITLGGNTERASLFAAYHFLETLGVRFIGYKERNGETIPRRPTISVGDLDIVTRPMMSYRFASDNNFAASDPRKLVPVVDWAAKNRCNAIGISPGRAGETWEGVAIDEIQKRGLLIVGPGHVLAQLTPDVKLFDTHPEYFPLIKGKRQSKFTETWGGAPSLCYSNKVAREIVVGNAVRYAKEHPYIDVLAIFPPDGPQKSVQCQCEACAKLSMSGWYLTLLNEISGALKAAKIDRKLVWIAYNELSVPPPPGTVEPVNEGRDMVFMWCNELRDLHEPMDSEANRRPPRLLEFKPALRAVKTDGKKNPADAELSAFHRWRAWKSYMTSTSFKGDVVVLDYYNAHVGASLRVPWMLYAQSGPWPDGLMQKDFQFYVAEAANFRGAGWQNCTDYFNDGPNPYWNRLSASLMWDPAMDVAAFDRDFYRGWYGPAAEPMQRYCEALWREVGRATVEPDDAAKVAALEPLLKEAEALAGRKDPQLNERMKMTRSFHDKCVKLKAELPATYNADGTPRERAR